MESIRNISRRSLLKGGSAAGTALTVMHLAGPSQAFGQPGEEVLPWLDQPAANPIPASVGNLLQWESLESWLTPANDFFFVSYPFGDSCEGEMASCPCGDDCRCIGCAIHSGSAAADFENVALGL